MGVVAIALACVLIAGATYLHQGAPPAPARTATPVTLDPMVINASFGDARHGAVIISVGPPSSHAYLTSDGGRNWRRPSPKSVIASEALFLGSRLVILGEGRGGGRQTYRISDDGGLTWREFVDPRQGRA